MTDTNKTMSFMGARQPTGYGIAGTSVACAFHNLGHKITFHDIAGQANYYNSHEEQLTLEYLVNQGVMFNYDAPCVKMWHQFNMDQWIGRGKKIGWPIFELDSFNEIEMHHLAFPDELVVCSQWAADIIETELKRKAHVVPLGVDPSVFYPGEKERDDSKPFSFLNMGKWEVRKGHDVLADIYNMAFRKDDNVKLVVHAPFAASEKERQDWISYYKNTKMGDSIEFLQRKLPTHKEVAQCMREHDCGIFPARAEGWNMELLEMMAVGKPVIALNASAQTQYCTEDNCRLVDFEELEPAVDGIWFHGQGSWPKIETKQMQEMADHMRAVYENWQFNEAGVQTGQAFSWENSAKILAEIL